MSNEEKPARLVEDAAALARRQPIVRKYNEVVYKPLQVEAFEILEPLERAREVERIANDRRLSAALAIANLVEADLMPRPDELDAFALLSRDWREAHDRRLQLQAEEDERFREMPDFPGEDDEAAPVYAGTDPSGPGWFRFRCSAEPIEHGAVEVFLGEQGTPEETLEAAKVGGAAGRCSRPIGAGRPGCNDVLVLALTSAQAEATLGHPSEVHGMTGYDEEHECARCGGWHDRDGWLCEACEIWAEEGR